MKYCALLFVFLSIACAGCAENQTTSMPLWHVAFSPDGKWLIAGGGTINQSTNRGVAKVWETGNWKVHHAWNLDFPVYVDGIFFVSPDSVATMNAKVKPGAAGDPSDGVLLQYWDLSKKKELDELHLKMAASKRLIGIHFPSKLIALYNRSSRACAIYTLPNLEEKIVLKDCPPAFLKFSPDGKKILAAVSQGGGNAPHVRSHDASGNLLASFDLTASNKGSEPTNVRAGRFSPDGKMVVIVTNRPDKTYLFKADLSAPLWLFDSPFSECVEFTPDNETIAVRKDDNTVQLQTIKTKEVVKSFGDNPDGANSWCFSADGAWIAIAGGGHKRQSGFSPGRVRVFEVKTGKLVAELD